MIKEGLGVTETYVPPLHRNALLRNALLEQVEQRALLRDYWLAAKSTSTPVGLLIQAKKGPGLIPPSLTHTHTRIYEEPAKRSLTTELACHDGWH